MPKKKQEKFSVVKAVKLNSRERLGAPGTTKVIPHKNKPKKPKYKPDPLSDPDE